MFNKQIRLRNQHLLYIFEVKMKVVHCKKESCDVYIGRPSKWGNPFTIIKDGDRDTVCDKYEEWLLSQPHLMASLKELKGQVLGCWCAPKRCHGDFLLRLANRGDNND